MGDCNFGHAKVPVFTESMQGACCDPDGKKYHNLQKGWNYVANMPLTIIDGSVPRTYKPQENSAEPFCGFRSCALDLTEAEEDCKASVCTKARDLITQTIAWPGTLGNPLQGGMVKFTNDDVEIVRANPKCCFEMDGAPCCEDPELPGCEEATEEGK